jgi:hypothetical protein
MALIRISDTCSMLQAVTTISLPSRTPLQARSINICRRSIAEIYATLNACALRTVVPIVDGWRSAPRTASRRMPTMAPYWTLIIVSQGGNNNI